METTRRTVLKTGLLTGTALAVPSAAAATTGGPRQNPFTLGVASGDPWPDGFVLWTRLAVEPLAADGLGGMPSRPLPVQWQVATDSQFRHVVRAGVATARPEHGHAVHVTLHGLAPDREYWYRFRCLGHLSRTARTRTAPAVHAMPRELAMSFVSCSQFEHGWFTAYRRLAEDRPDLVLHLGDYQYEYIKGAYVAPGGNVRDHEGPETTDLATYRQRHAQYKTDPDLQAAHAVAPWLVVFDGDILGQQVFFAQRNNNSGPLKVTSMDSWDGYVASRNRITRGWVDAGVRNPVVLTGDVHAHWASDLKLDYDDPTGPSVGAELVCSSITSGGNGADSASGSHPWLAWNPHLRFQNNLRGYVNTTITRDRLDADFRCVRAVQSPDAEVFTRASFAIADREPGLHQTHDNPPAITATAARTAVAADDTVAWETARP